MGNRVLKKGNAHALPLLMQRYKINRLKANVMGKRFTCKNGLSGVVTRMCRIAGQPLPIKKQ